MQVKDWAILRMIKRSHKDFEEEQVDYDGNKTTIIYKYGYNKHV